MKLDTSPEALHRKIDKVFNKLGQMQTTVGEVATATEAAVEQAIEISPPVGQHQAAAGDRDTRQS